MAVSLSKGGNISLTKAAPGLTSVTVGLGWDARTTLGTKFDLDASFIGVNAEGHATGADDFVFYGNPFNAARTLTHGGDNTTGEGSGDDEKLMANLAALPPEVARVVVVVSIYEGEKNGQNFGQVRNAYVRVVSDSTNEELVRYDLSEDYAAETALIFAEFYRHGTEWKFRAVGQGYSNGLAGIAKDFHLPVS